MLYVKITNDGRESIEDYRSIYSAVLYQLTVKDQDIYDLVTNIRTHYHEFKYIELKIIVRAVVELSKQKMVEVS